LQVSFRKRATNYRALLRKQIYTRSSDSEIRVQELFAMEVSCRSLYPKGPPIVRLFCGKRPTRDEAIERRVQEIFAMEIHTSSGNEVDMFHYVRVGVLCVWVSMLCVVASGIHSQSTASKHSVTLQHYKQT